MRQKLLTSVKIRGVEFPNRIVLSPMQMYEAKSDGRMTDWHLVHLGKFASANFGAVFTEVLCVEKRGRSTYSDAGIWSDRHVPQLKKIADFIRAQGSVPAAQIGHCGPKSSRQRPYDGLQPLSRIEGDDAEKPWDIVSCSDIPAAPGYDTPRALSRSAVKSLVRKFGAAARRCDQAGFDVLDVHAAHGYLIHSFLSPLSNFRTDEYGGSEANRNRFAVEIAREIRKYWPADKPLFFRLSCIDRFAGGLEIENTINLSRSLKDEGVDVIDCSSGGIKGPNSLFSLASKEPPSPGFQVPFAEEIRKQADMATMAVGMIIDPDQANSIIEDGKADLVALGREALSNPNWPLHAMRALHEDRSYEDWPPNIGWWLEVRQRMLQSSNPDDWKVGPAAQNTPKRAASAQSTAPAGE